MDARFAAHNTHLESDVTFSELDPHLRRLKAQYYSYESPLLQKLPQTEPGIYSLTGGRQIGKTTLLKQWMAQLLARGINPQSIAFFTGELIDDFHALVRLLQNQIAIMPKDAVNFLLIDEITYIKDWDKAIKFVADTGFLENVILLLTGSDLLLIKAARMRFPGRRGKADQVDFHLFPLSFVECVKLKKVLTEAEIVAATQQQQFTQEIIDKIYSEFNNYLQHGGYLTAINDLAMNKTITNATLMTYSDWVRGDVLKRGKQERYLSEILTTLIKKYNSQLTWHAIAKDISIDSHVTVADYINILQSLDVLFVQSALIEDKLAPAPKKARKVYFTDPFIFHAIRAWVSPRENAYIEQILPAVADPILSAGLVEACVVAHYARLYPTYYIHAEGEVDIAYVDKNSFWPIEIKWTNQIRPQEIKQIMKYKNGRIFDKVKEYKFIHHIPLVPLPLALLSL